jgi:hypothetical protein
MCADFQERGEQHMSKRINYDTAFKARVVLGALKRERTVLVK